MRNEGLSEEIITKKIGVSPSELGEEITISRDLVKDSKEITLSQEPTELLRDILKTVAYLPPILRSILCDYGEWDLDRLEENIREVLEVEESQ